MNKKIKKETRYLTWCEIDQKAIRHNLKEIRKVAQQNNFYLPTRKGSKFSKNKDQYMLPVIKANAYGHGLENMARLLEKEKIKILGVSDLAEGMIIRKLGIKIPVLLFESTMPEMIREIVRHQLMPSICDFNLAKQLNDYAKRARKSIDVHIKIDTGMGRLGVWHEDAYSFILKLHELTHLRLIGIFTHFPAADTDKKFTQKQIHWLYDLVTQLDKKGIVIPYIHAANSMGLGGYKTHILNLARPGLLLYGLYPHASLKKKMALKPVMSVYSRIIFIKDVKKGRSISYGRTFFSKKDLKIATIPIGYNDGYFRALSNKAFVIIKGVRCPVVGRVTMDQIMVDVSRVKAARQGDLVTILGKQKKETVTADELAGYAGTINYEVICNLGNRLSHIYK